MKVSEGLGGEKMRREKKKGEEKQFLSVAISLYTLKPLPRKIFFSSFHA